jgi:putative ABC transport system ATP-binding protein
MPMGEPGEVLVAMGLSRLYRFEDGRIAGVRDASLRVFRRELVAVYGRAGSGKSTLLKLCGGLDRPDHGRVLVDGVDVGQLEDEQRQTFLRRTVGWVFQSPQLVPMLTAEENVRLAMRIAGEPQSEAIRITQMALEAVGLDDRARHRGNELSRGERQRVALARALVKSPALVLADEPTAQLDLASGRDLMMLLRDAARSEVAVMFTTHDELEAAQADRVFVMDDGVLREGG